MKMINCDSLENVIEEDTSVVPEKESLWHLVSDKPEIKQIYGHFLPPIHMKKVKGIVAVDFNFPAAYHAIDSEFSEINANLGGKIRIDSATKVRLNKSVRIRQEKNGAVVYTPYFNGFFINSVGYKMINSLSDACPLAKVAEVMKIEVDLVFVFVARLLSLGIVNLI